MPYDFSARDYQRNFLREVERALAGKSDTRYFVQVWHRRSGKDKTNIADVAPRALLMRQQLVKYVYPTLVMGRQNLWETIGSDGKPFLKHIPDEIRKGDPNNTRMTIPIINGSLFQVAGTDNPDSLRGGNPRVIIFSEWSEHNPYAFDVVEPILRENDGIAIFNFTPKGDNHAKATYDFAENRPGWWRQKLTANDTGVFSVAQLAQIRQDTIDRFRSQGRGEEEAIAFFDQEYMCSFDSPVIGSYYGAAMRIMQQQGRLTRIPWEPQLPVHTVWDLGIGDSTAIWFIQVIGREIRCIDYYEASGEGIPHYIDVLRKRGYIYGEVFWPHDGKQREFTTGTSRHDTARAHGLNVTIIPQAGVADGIEATRAMLMRTWIDKDKCKRGVDALKNYKKKWNEQLKIFMDHPDHDWSSHGADGMRYVSAAVTLLGGGDSVIEVSTRSTPQMLDPNLSVIELGDSYGD
jgi:phage terminase large subunit